MAKSVAERLRNQGIGVTVIDPRWVLPVPEAIGELAKAHKLVVTLEDNGVRGGVGSAVSAALRRAEIDVPCRDVGLPQEFQAHASRGEVLADVGLTDQDIARQVTGWVAALGSAVSEHEVSQPARLSETRPASSSVVDLRGCSKNTSRVTAVDLDGRDGVPEQRAADVGPGQRRRGHPAPAHPPSGDGGRGPRPAEHERRFDEQRHVVVHR